MLDEHPRDYESNVFAFLNTKFNGPIHYVGKSVYGHSVDKYFERCINCVG